MINGFKNWYGRYPKLNYAAIPRIIKGMGNTGGEDTWEWYDKKGNTVQRDPSQRTQVYDPMGVRWVFALGDWQEDDPERRFAFNHPLTQLFLNTAAQGFTPRFPANIGRFLGGGDPAPNQHYEFMDANGNYIEDGKVLEPGSLAWLSRKWGKNIPDSEIEKLMVGLTADGLDPTPEETLTLDYYVQQARAINSPGLVKLNRAINPGDTFYINGQRAIMGSPDTQGRMQYATSQQGEGDRWKYKIIKDGNGNWVRTYYRTFGAKKEKEMRFKKKHKNS